MTGKPILVGEVLIDYERFPKLYKFAHKNPKGLEDLLKSLAKASGGDQSDLTLDAINLENDLQHG